SIRRSRIRPTNGPTSSDAQRSPRRRRSCCSRTSPSPRRCSAFFTRGWLDVSITMRSILILSAAVRIRCGGLGRLRRASPLMTTSSDVEQRAEPGGGAAAGLHPFGLCSDWEPDALQFRAEIEVADPPPVDQHAGPEADEVTRIEARLPPDELVSG